MSVLPRWLDKMNKKKEFKCTRKLPGRRLCIRETKWTAPVLKQLHEELKCRYVSRLNIKSLFIT